MNVEKHERRPRGSSPRGDFELSKSFATTSEVARVAADKRKTEELREARLRRDATSKQASS